MAFKKNNRGSYVLMGEDGEEFTVTKSEYQQLQTLTKRANQRRVDVAHRYYDSLSNSEVMVGKSYESYMTLLQHNGFITEKYSTSLKQFSSKNDVKDLLKELKTVTKRGYGNNRIDDIRYKMLERIEENFGEQGKDLYSRIAEMDKSELLAIYTLSDDDLIKTVYGCDRAKDTNELVEKSLTEINVLLKNSKNNYTIKESEFKKGFNNYKNRQKYKKDMKQKRMSTTKKRKKK